MTDHIKVDESFINALVKNAAWDAARLSITEGEKKGDNFIKNSKEGDKPDFTKASKGDKKKTDDDDADEMKESVEEHTCPLCESHLEEALTDAQISEHVGQIQDALLSLEEEAEEAEEDEEEDLEEEEYDTKRDADAVAGRGGSGGKVRGTPQITGKPKPSDDKDMDEKKKKVMKKVKELKSAAKGK
tara:strand:+ start:2049 stop:2609 length:561 start_codon:yes stop_codon:yes gene_type:complete